MSETGNRGFHAVIAGDVRPPCVHAWADLWVNAAGKATCCPENRRVLGDLNAQTVDEMWNSSAAQETRALFARGDYERAGCNKECPFLRGSFTPPETPPPLDELINAEFALPNDGTVYAVNAAQVLRDYRERRAQVCSLPLFIDVQAVLRCNADCIMCGQPHQSKLEHGPELTARLERLKPAAQWFRWQGGEVFMSKEFTERLENFDHGDNPHLRRYVITNASVLNAERIERLIGGARPVTFLISIDGVTAPTYTRIRRRLDHRRAMENLALLARKQKERGRRDLVRWNYVVMRATLHEMRAAIDHAAELGVDLNFAPIQGPFEQENVFLYPEIADIDLPAYFSELERYAATQPIRVSGFVGMQQRLVNAKAGGTATAAQSHLEREAQSG
jgi:sulfatase maturation enzyme AslB (radical SAM superfamily)